MVTSRGVGVKQLFNQISRTLAGDVSVSDDDMDYYSTDGSVFTLTPSAVVYPKDVNDVSELVKMVNDTHSNGNDRISITARGNGTDQGGGPLNTGIILDFMRYMDQILEIGDDYAVVQPGCLYGRLQKELKKHQRYIPSYPASIEISTIGGAVANNAAGEKTVKYGATRQYVDALQVVLADGSVTWLNAQNTQQIEENKYLGGLEGEIYRNLAKLIYDNFDAIHNGHPHTTKESSGYALWEVTEAGQFNAAEVVVGSQGTLCLVTAIRLKTVPLPDPGKVQLLIGHFDSVANAGLATQDLNRLSPSALEIVDKNLLNLVNKQSPEMLEGLLPEQHMPEIVLLCEFDDHDNLKRAAKVKKAQSIIDHYAFSSSLRNTADEQESAWKLRRSAAAIIWTIPGNKKALPIIEDGTVPPHKLTEFIQQAYAIFDKYDLDIAIWGHAGDADLHMQPFLDLSKVTDRKKLFRIADEFYEMVHQLGGTAAGEHNDSLMRSPYRSLMFGQEMESLFDQVKQIFDPDNIFNPHKKVGVDFNYIKKHLRHEYSIKSIAHMDRKKAQQTIDR